MRIVSVNLMLARENSMTALDGCLNFDMANNVEFSLMRGCPLRTGPLPTVYITETCCIDFLQLVLG